MNNLLHMFKGKSSLAGSFSELRRVNPFREWVVGLCFALTVIILGGAYALQIFMAGYTDAPMEGTVSSDTVHYNSTKVEEVLEMYKKRSADTARFEAEKITLPSPALEESQSVEEESVSQKPNMQVE